jgi:uncharacterized protein
LARREQISDKSWTEIFDKIGDFLESPEGCDVLPTFVFHGGEPTLLGRSYFESIVSAQRDTLQRRGIAYKNGVQTNLYSYDRELLRFLTDNGFGIGVSFDVFGQQRVSIRGIDSAPRVRKNIENLVNDGIDFGVVAVVNADSVGMMEDLYRYFNDLQKSCQLIPVFWQPYMSENQRRLCPSPEQVVDSFLRVADLQLDHPNNQPVSPIYDFEMAALRQIRTESSWHFDPRRREWCLVLDVNGNIYNYGDAYSELGLMGNIFVDSFSSTMSGPRRNRAANNRIERERPCLSCEHSSFCNHLPMMESHASERSDREALACQVAQPTIAGLVKLLSSDGRKIDNLLRQRAKKNPIGIELE